MTLPLLIACTLTSGLLIGLIPAMVDSLKRSWQDRLSASAGSVDWVVRLFYFTWLPAMPAAGWLLDRYHAKGILFAGLIALIGAIAWLGMVRSLSSLAGSVTVLGAAYSVVTTCTIRLMADAILPKDGTLAALNLGFISVAVGAWLGPELLALAERWWGYRHALLYLSLACIGPAVLTALTDGRKFQIGPEVPYGSYDVLTHPHLALLAGIILIYFAIENCLEFWPEPYLRELGYDRNVRSGMLVFWGAFICARGVVAWWLYLHPDQAFGLTVVLAIASAMLMGNLVGGYEVGSGSVGFWLAGACYGPMLPCFLGIALRLFPNLSSIAVGALLALSGLDTLIVRPLMHAYAVDRPARTVMRVPTVLALLLAAPLLILAFVRQ